MNKIINYLIFLLLITISNISFADSSALVFNKIIVPEAPPVASVMAAYMDITNNNKKAKVIKHISSSQFKRVEIHSMSMANGMMKMEQMQTLTVQPGKTVKLETGGLHIMLIKPIQTLKHGDSVELTFTLVSGEIITVDTTVQKIDLSNSHKHHHH